MLVDVLNARDMPLRLFEDTLTVTDENEPRLVGGPSGHGSIGSIELGRIRIIRRPKAKKHLFAAIR